MKFGKLWGYLKDYRLFFRLKAGCFCTTCKSSGEVFFKKFVVVEMIFLEKTLDISQFLWHN